MDQQIQKEAPPDTKKMVRQLEETTGIAADMMGKLHEQGGMDKEVIGVGSKKRGGGREEGGGVKGKGKGQKGGERKNNIVVFLVLINMQIK